MLLGETCSLGCEALEDNIPSGSFEQLCEDALALGQALIQSSPPRPKYNGDKRPFSSSLIDLLNSLLWAQLFSDENTMTMKSYGACRQSF